MILSTSYLPPIWYFNKIKNCNQFQIDLYEHFVKQTIRNRCHILSPNGIQSLIIPVMHLNRTVTPVRDIRIANDHQWQRQHWRSVNSCYRRSPYFEFYMDDFAPFYHKKYEYLHDFNTGLLNLILEAFKITPIISLTRQYEKPEITTDDDFRILCDSGVPVVNTLQKSYPQVFSYKSGFTGGLSGIDLLFNVGPAAVNYL